MEGYSQKDIARLMRLSEKTISNYARRDNWRDAKASFDLMKDNSTQRIMKLIDYQTRALEARVENWKELDPNGEQVPPLLERGDIDGLQKLWTTVKRDAKKFSDYIAVLKEYHEWLQNQDLDLAKSSIEQAERFINEKRKVL